MRLTAVAIACALGACLLGATPAQAAFGIFKFEGGVLNRDGTSFTQAGGHPYEASTKFMLIGRGPFNPDGQMKDVVVDLPPGFVGNPTASPTTCAVRQLSSPAGTLCPVGSQVGVAETLLPEFLPGIPLPFGRGGVYNMAPPPGAPAMLAFAIGRQPALLIPTLRSDGDYGISVRSADVSQLAPVVGVTVTLWGVPADPSHDDERGTMPGNPGAFCASPFWECSNPFPADHPARPFVTTPTNCSVGAQATTLQVASWGDPGRFNPDGSPDPTDPNWKTASFSQDTNGNPTAVTGCEALRFEPSISVQPTNRRPDSPTGLEVQLTMPQQSLEDPDGLAQAHLKRAVVTLPEGMSVNPAAADGLGACAPSQINLTGPLARTAPTCPDSAKIGSVEIDTPLLEQPLHGHVYVASQGDNPFGSLLALYIVAEGPGIVVKLPGRVDPDPVTGRLTTTFDDNPQVPFSSLTLRLKGGPRAPLANPPVCGEKTVSAELSPWSAANPDNPVGGEVVRLTDSFAVECPGMSGFAVGLSAGLTSPRAGAFSPFTLRVDRPDLQEFVDGLDVELPAGLVAKVKDVPLCGEADAAAGACPPSSRIGTVTAGAGPGSSPFHLPGTVSLTGGYRGAPYGLSIAVPAKAGPFDLGTVVVRQAIFVDPVTAEIRAASDPIPTIREGIPFRLRTVQVDVDREQFMVAPTSCAEQQVRARVHSEQGSSADLASRFQVGDCAALPLSPKLSMRLTGRRQVADGRHPGLRVRLSQDPGEANLRRVVTKLPLSLALDPENAQSDALCEFEAGQRVDCPASSIIGRATAISPLLKGPLSGPVHFVKNVRTDRRTGRQIRTLPTLLIPLRGEIALNLRAETSVEHGKLVTTFPLIPDAAISSFRLRLNGGQRGILTVTDTNLCRKPRGHITQLEADGHSGRRFDRGIRMETPCRKSGKAALKVANARWHDDQLTVQGRVNRRAKRDLRVTVRCGDAGISRPANPDRRGWWKRTLALRGRCLRVGRVLVTVRYPGGPRVRRQAVTRGIRRAG